MISYTVWRAKFQKSAKRDGFFPSMSAVTSRKEQEVAAQYIAASRQSLNYSDDFTSPHNEFDDILDEICAETGYASYKSEDEMWRTSLKARAWKLYKAVMQASASRKPQNFSKPNATCTMSQEGGSSVDPSQLTTQVVMVDFKKLQKGISSLYFVSTIHSQKLQLYC